MLEDYLTIFGIVGLICIVLLLFIVEISAIILVAGFLASYFGFSGVMWWAVAIVLFLIINGIIGALL